MSASKLRNLVLLLLAFILLKSEMLSQESGWQQKGNLKYQIAAIDTIIQHGISVSGDTLWTFCQDSTLYYWDIESGNLINKKKFDDIYRISVDLKSYMLVKKTNNNPIHFRAYIYSMQTDTLISNALLFNLPRPDPVFTTTVIIQKYDFDFDNKKLYLTTTDSRSSPKDWGDQHYSHIFVIEKDTAIKILPKNFMGPDFIFNRNFTKIISCWHNSYSHKEYGTNESAYITHFDKTANKAVEIFGNKRETGQPSLTIYIMPRFLNDDSYISTIIFPNIYIWDISSKKQITKFRVENQNPGIFDYCFSHSDEFISYSNKMIYLYDTLSQSIKDSAEVEGINKNISLKHSFKNNKILFFAANKFGIFESEFFENNDNPKISYDSNHVYVGLPIKFYLLNKNEYEKIEWFSSKGLIGEGKNPTFTFDEPGIESITVRFTRNGNVTEKTYENLLEILPQLKADFSADITEGIAPLTVQFKNQSSGAILSYKWEFRDSSGHHYASIEENPKITFEYDGYYNVRLTIKDKYYNNAANKTLFVQVNKTKVNVVKNLKYFTKLGGSYLDIYSKKYINYIINSPGTVILNENVYLYYTLWGSYNILPSYLVELDKNLQEIEENQVGNMLVSNQFTDFESIGNNELILSGNGKYNRDWYVTKFNNDLSTNISFYLGFTSNEYETYFNVNSSNMEHYFAFSNNKHSLFLKFDSELKLLVNDTIYTKMYGFTKYSDNLIAMVHSTPGSSDINIMYFNQNLIPNNNYILDGFSNTHINYIITLPNKHIAFCGFDTVDSLGVVGTINYSGKIDWIRKFPNWKNFNRLLVNGNAVYAIGESECFIGFLEFDMKGEKFSHNGFYDSGIKKTIDLDFFKQDSVLLTYKIIDMNYICLAMCQFIPLDIEGIQDTTKNPGDSIIGIISPKIKVSPNPATNEVKFEFEEELMVKSIEIYNTEGVLIEILNYAGIKSKEIVLNIKKYSIGIYFVKIQTEKGSSKTKFVKS